MATRTSNVYIRVEPEIKNQAENVLNQLGIPMSNAVGMFLRQVVLKRGIPFDMKLPPPHPLSIEQMTREQFHAELQKGIDDVDAGRTSSLEDVKTRLHAKYGV